MVIKVIADNEEKVYENIARFVENADRFILMGEDHSMVFIKRGTFQEIKVVVK